MPVKITGLSVIRNAIGEWVSGRRLPDGTFDIINFYVVFTLAPPLTGKRLSSECYIDGKRIGDAWEPSVVTDDDAGDYGQEGHAQLRFELPSSIVLGHTFTLKLILDGVPYSRDARFYTKEEIFPRNVVRALAIISGVCGASAGAYVITRRKK